LQAEGTIKAVTTKAVIAKVETVAFMESLAHL
jgi:hypothetical protein